METLAFQGLIGLSVAMYLWLLPPPDHRVRCSGVLNFATAASSCWGLFRIHLLWPLGDQLLAAIVLSLLSVAVVGYLMERYSCGTSTARPCLPASFDLRVHPHPRRTGEDVWEGGQDSRHARFFEGRCRWWEAVPGL